MPVACAALPEVEATVECPLTIYEIPIGGGIPISAVFELLGAGLLLYQLIQQYELWERDLENLQELAECYEEIGTCYKEARLALRGRDQEVYDYQNSRPSYPGPCESRIQQARLNALLEISQAHEQALRVLPGWACGDKTKADYDAAKASVVSSMHFMGTSRNYEQNLEDQYEQMRITALARSVGGAVPNLSGAFRTVAAIAQDNLSRSTAGFNSALGAFGNVVGSLGNKYLSIDLNKRTAKENKSGDVNVQNNSSVVNDNRTIQQSSGGVGSSNSSSVGFSSTNAFSVGDNT